MEMVHEDISGVAVLTLSGRLDAVTAPALSRQLQELIDSGRNRLLFDCAALTYISSAGLQVFLVSAKCLEARGGSMAFCSLGRSLGQIFAMTDFARLFPVHESREAALAGH